MVGKCKTALISSDKIVSLGVSSSMQCTNSTLPPLYLRLSIDILQRTFITKGSLPMNILLHCLRQSWGKLERNEFIWLWLLCNLFSLTVALPVSVLVLAVALVIVVVARVALPVSVLPVGVVVPVLLHFFSPMYLLCYLFTKSLHLRCWQERITLRLVTSLSNFLVAYLA